MLTNRRDGLGPRTLADRKIATLRSDVLILIVALSHPDCRATDQEPIEEIAVMQLDPEDGVLSVVDCDDETAVSVVVFTNFGIKCVREMLDEHIHTTPPAA